MKHIHTYLKSALIFQLVSAFLITGCSDPVQKTAQTPPPPTVTVMQPIQKSITEIAEFTGTTEASELVVIRSRVEGVLEKVHFKPGSQVKKGDLLFSIDDRQYQTDLKEARAALEIREAELALAETTAERRERAFHDKAVSEVSVLEARSALASAKGAVAAAKSAVERAELNLSYTRISAPVSGKAGRPLVDVGNLLKAGEVKDLATIVQASPIYVYFTISEKEFLKYEQLDNQPSPLNTGSPVFLKLSQGSRDTYRGEIDYIDNRMDQETGTIRVRSVFKNENRKLVPGLFTRIKIPVGNEKQAFLFPDTAFGRDQSGHYLLTVSAENKVIYQPVTVGGLSDGMRVIKSGIKADDRIVLKGLQKVRPGAVVTPKFEALEKGITKTERETSSRIGG